MTADSTSRFLTNHCDDIFVPVFVCFWQNTNCDVKSSFIHGSFEYLSVRSNNGNRYKLSQNHRTKKKWRLFPFRCKWLFHVVSLFFKSALNFISPDGSNRVYFIAICLVSLGHVEIERWKRRSTIVSNINGRIYHVSIKRRVVPLCTKIGNPPNSLITIWGHNRIVLHKIFLNSI